MSNMEQLEQVGFRLLHVIVACAVFLTNKSVQVNIEDDRRSPIVQTESGAIVGKIEVVPNGKAVYEYLGIPYAEPPVGELRFAAPKPAKPWSNVMNATEFGAVCPQNRLLLDLLSVVGGFEDWLRSAKMSEDCLFLNVFVPTTIKQDEKMAVMVWIHGGGFVVGSSSFTPGGVLASFNDVIIVSINYRLGVLGFFNVPGTDVKGNYGILDQLLAFKWVQSNIASFGGDPNRVTIFGESSGGMSASLHLISPLSKGLFRRAILQSGASSTPLFCGNVSNTEQLELFAKYLKCVMGQEFVQCVRGKAVEDILTTQKIFTLDNFERRRTQDFVAPVVDGRLLPDLPETLFRAGRVHKDIDVITGVTSNEGGMFAMLRPPSQLKDGLEKNAFENIVRDQTLYHREKSQVMEDLILFQYTNHTSPHDKNAIRQSMMEIWGDSAFDGPVMLEAKALAKGGRVSTYMYVFNHRPNYSPLADWLGAIHGADVPFLFGAPFEKIPDPWSNVLTTKYSEMEKGLSLYVMKLWTNFAKYGSPNPPDVGLTAITWPVFTEEEQAYLVLDLKPRVERRYKAKKMAFWNEMIPKVAKFVRNERKDADEKAPKDEL